jgi:hypothetical protein
VTEPSWKPGAGWTKNSRLRRISGLAARRWWTAPLVVVLGYTLTLATQFKQIVGRLYLNADAASAPVIGELYGRGGGHAEVLLGHLGWYSTLLFELGTRWLPAHRAIWEAAPYAMALASAACIAWGALKVGGKWGGALAVAIVVCASPAALGLLLVMNDHAPTWFTLAVLGAFVVLLEERAARMRLSLLVGLTFAVGVVLGINAASDELASTAVGLPFVAALAFALAVRPSRASAWAFGIGMLTLLVAGGSAVLVHAFMAHENVVKAADPQANLLAGGETVGTNFKLWWESLVMLGNGNFFGEEIGVSSILALSCAAMTIAAAVFATKLVRAEVAGAFGPRRPADPPRAMRLAWTVYWSGSVGILSVAFIFSQAPEGLASSRYLVGVIYGIAALLPLLSGQRQLTRALLTAAVSVYAFVGWLGLAQEQIRPLASPTDQMAATIERFARLEHLKIGYAGYWDAAPITWATHMAVDVYPVTNCYSQPRLCRFFLHLISSWYTPEPGIKSFLLADPATPVPANPTPDLGKPTAVHQIGTITMYVYPYDIARAIATEAPPPPA